MAITISRAAYDDVMAHAAAELPNECCGILLGSDDNIILDILPCRNVAENPLRRFEIDPGQLIAAERAMRGGGPQVIGYYHSHPVGPALPSATDATQSAQDGRIWLIVGQGAVTCWRNIPDGEVEGAFNAVEWQIIAN